MKQFKKKMVAMLCICSLVAGMILVGDYHAVEASTTKYEGTIIENWTLGGGVNTETYDPITTDAELDMTDYRVHIRMYIPEDVYKTIEGKTLHIELCETTCDDKEFDFDRTDFKAGENEWILTWDKASWNNGATWGQSIGFIRVYADNGSITLAGCIIREIKVVRMEDREWTVFNQKNFGENGTPADKLETEISFDEDVNEANMIAHIELNIDKDMWTDEHGRNTIDTVVIELRPVSDADQQEFQFNIPVSGSGVTTYNIRWSEASKTTGAALSEGLKYYRIYQMAEGKAESGVPCDAITFTFTIIDATPYVEEHASVWTMVDETIPSTKLFDKTNMNYILPLAKNNVKFILTLDIPETLKDTVCDNKWTVKFGHTNDYGQEADFGDINVTKTGINQFELLGSSTSLTSANPINRFFVLHNGQATDIGGVKVNVKVVELQGTAITAGKTPTELGADCSRVPENYIFAGWYTDESCTSATTLEGEASSPVFAKYVRKGLLNVKAQKTTYTNEDGNEVGAVRFITSVDSTQYQQVGFDITINDRTLSKYSNKVYSELYAVNASSGDKITYKPYNIDPVGLYFSAFTIDEIPENGFDTEITVQPYWITQDGAKVYGESKTYTFNSMEAE